MKKYIFSVVFISLIASGCKIDKSLFDDSKSDDISFIFTDAHSEFILRFWSQYNAFEGKAVNYCNESMSVAKFATNADRNSTGKIYFLVNGQRSVYANTGNCKEVAEVFSKPKVNLQFIGDTLGLVSFGPKEMEVPAPFKFLNLSASKVKSGEDLVVFWNPGYKPNGQVLIQLNYDDLLQMPSEPVAELNKKLATCRWNKFTEDNGEFVIKAEVFEKLPLRGNYKIDVFRASNLVEKGKTRVDVTMVAQAYKTFYVE